MSVQVLSPAGSFEALSAAIEAGADAIYCGVGALNMRSQSAANFTVDDFPEIVARVHAASKKVYLTVNTIVYDGEIDGMYELLRKARGCKIDAVIASDFAAIAQAQKLGLTIHISTQANISNIEAVKFYAQFADTMVLARELSLEQQAKICLQIRDQDIRGPQGRLVAIEVFVHGALCMAISGKCYMSLHTYGKSANRGSCLQNCRRTYTLTDTERGDQIEVDREYLMSPKDLCSIRFLDKILDAGVSILKIEGRARSPEYVKRTTEIYRQAVEDWQTGCFTEEKTSNYEKLLAEVFNRGFWGGYYLGKEIGEWVTGGGSQATKTKVHVGKISNYFSKISVAEIVLESGHLEKGDEILIIGPDTGVYEGLVDELRIEDQILIRAEKGQVCSVKTLSPVKRADKVYKLI